MAEKERRTPRLWNRASIQVWMAFKGVILTRGAIFAVAVLLIPTLISIYTLADPPKGSKEWIDLFCLFGVLAYLQFFLLIYSLIYGTHMMNEDIDRRTMVYLVIRSSKRAEVLLYRYIGTYLGLTLLLVAPLVLNFVILGMHGSVSTMVDNLDVLLLLIGAMLIGNAVYLALFAVFGIAFKRPLMAGLLFSFFWEVVMVNIPSNVRKVTIMYYIRSLFLSNSAVRNAIDYGAGAEVPGTLVFLFILLFSFVLLGCALFSRKELP